jgi:uncharacterized membrane protein YjgN (DUF898 family)
MSDKVLGDALLRLNLTPPALPSAVEVERIIEADRRRIRWHTRITVGLWILAFVGALSIFVGGGFVFPVIAKMLKQADEGSIDEANTPFLMLAKLTAMCIAFGSLSFAILVAAGLATVLLVFRSRRATLRQINANLLQISEQLKRLGQPPPGRAEPAK